MIHCPGPLKRRIYRTPSNEQRLSESCKKLQSKKLAKQHHQTLLKIYVMVTIVPFVWFNHIDACRKMFRIFSLFLWLSVAVKAQQSQDPMTINGGSLLAMTGKNCVAVAVDKRFGSGPQLVNIAPRHVWTPHPNLMVAFVGLEGDVQSLSQDLQVQVSSKLGRALGFSLQEEVRRISPRALASITSHIMYQGRGRYYVEPLIVGLNPHSHEPFLCSMDMIGAQSFSKEFVCSGAASKSLFGIAEALWRPDMEEQELVETCGKAFQSALERDCLSGYGSLVYLITKRGITEYDLIHRND